MNSRRIILTVTADNEPFVLAGKRLLEGRLHRALAASQSHSHAIRELQSFDINSTCFILIITIVIDKLVTSLLALSYGATVLQLRKVFLSHLDSGSGFCWLAWGLGKHSALHINVNKSSASRFATSQKKWLLNHIHGGIHGENVLLGNSLEKFLQGQSISVAARYLRRLRTRLCLFLIYSKKKNLMRISQFQSQKWFLMKENSCSGYDN